MKTLILGGNGDLDEKLAKEMRRFDLDVTTRKLKGDKDLGEELLPFPIVINASDADCSSIAAFCLAENIVFIETQSSEQNIKALKALKIDNASGTIILGGGPFTGLGNLLAGFLKSGTLSVTPNSLGKARKIDGGFYVVDEDKTHPFFRFFADLFSPPGTPALVVSQGEKRASLEMKDIISCGGLSLGAMVLEIVEGREVPTGIRSICDVFFLESNISLIDAISPEAIVSNLA